MKAIAALVAATPRALGAERFRSGAEAEQALRVSQNTLLLSVSFESMVSASSRSGP
jgi:hypothetical protein